MKTQVRFFDISKVENKFDSILNDSDHEKISKFLKESDRERYKVFRGLTKESIAKFLDKDPKEIHILYDENRKPYVDEEIEFSYSHSGDYFALIISKVRVGIDIQVKKDSSNMESIAKRICSTSELEVFSSLCESKKKGAFYELWTKKEAYSKYLGLGFKANFKKMKIDLSKVELVSKDFSGFSYSFVYEKLDQLNELDLQESFE